ncbi:MAG: hypothetical protein Q9207_006698 [Kuettlingeria erythrocarpa]
MHYKTAFLAALAVATLAGAAPVNQGTATEAEPAVAQPLIDFFYLGYDAQAADSKLKDREVMVTAKERD